MKKSLKSFDPDMVARTECKAWKAYYEHRFLNLFFILTNFLRNFFGFGYWRSIEAGTSLFSSLKTSITFAFTISVLS